MKYRVSEIFESVQGEGLNMGHPCTFIRMFGCNLNCPWCDSKETWTTTAGAKYAEYNVEQIVEMCKSTLVVITGGEPLAQDLIPLIKELQEQHHAVAIETNGSLNIDESDIDDLFIACSPKAINKYIIHEGLLPNEIKLVADEHLTIEKVEEIIEFVRSYYLYPVAVWIQPCDNKDEVKNKESVLRAYQICQATGARLGIQAHKYWNVR